jgi:hypothetical protein
VPEAAAVSELDYYREVQRLRRTQSLSREALSFARVFSDLARRVLTARQAQSGEPSQAPPALALPALRAYFTQGGKMTPRDFRQAAPGTWNGDDLELLASLAGWLAPAYDPQDPWSGSYQVWVDRWGSTAIALYGPSRESPPPPLALAPRLPAEDWLLSQRERPVAVIAHYDVHGLSMLALTLRYLRNLGISDVDCTLSFEHTGDISKLWKRTVPRAITSERDYAAIIMIDCSVHSRKPERTLKALDRLDQAPNCRFYLVDHHDDTQRLAPELLRSRLNVVLTDILGCGLYRNTAGIDGELMVLGALGDKVPEVSACFSAETHPQLHAANQAFHQRLIHFSPTPREMKVDGVQPLKPLWEALADGRPVAPETAEAALGALEPPPLPPLPDHQLCGSLLFVTDRLTSVGRTWYAILERLMRQTGTPYAAALRILDERRANMLLLTHWNSIELPPIRHFVPAEYWPRCLGHMAAVWIDVPKSEALVLLEAVARNLNKFLNTEEDFQPVAEALEQRIINAPPSNPANLT